LVVRIVAVIWSAGMLTAVDSVGIITQGEVELESSRQIYNNILWAAFSSLLTEAAIKKKDEQPTSSPLSSQEQTEV
jgi:hypothetical protein